MYGNGERVGQHRFPVRFWQMEMLLTSFDRNFTEPIVAVVVVVVVVNPFRQNGTKVTLSRVFVYVRESFKAGRHPCTVAGVTRRVRFTGKAPVSPNRSAIFR